MIVGGRILGFVCRVTSIGHVGGEFGGGQQEGIIDAPRLSNEGDDKKTDPVAEKCVSIAVEAGLLSEMFEGRTSDEVLRG